MLGFVARPRFVALATDLLAAGGNLFLLLSDILNLRRSRLINRDERFLERAVARQQGRAIALAALRLAKPTPLLRRRKSDFDLAGYQVPSRARHRLNGR